MGVDGIYGSDVEADTDEEAISKATAMGYDVLDVTDSMQGPLLIIEGD
jgi:hypothetical protein